MSERMPSCTIINIGSKIKPDRVVQAIKRSVSVQPSICFDKQGRAVMAEPVKQRTILLKPGQQVIVSDEHGITTNVINTGKYASVITCETETQLPINPFRSEGIAVGENDVSIQHTRIPTKKRR